MPSLWAVSSSIGTGSLGTLVLQLVADSTRLVDDVGKARTSVSQAAADMTLAVGALAAATTAAFAAIGASTVKAFATWESSFASVRKTVQATDEQFQQLGQTLRDMAKVMPTNVNDLNQIAASAGQLGIQTSNIAKFTKVVADLGVSTNLNMHEAGIQIAQLANITQMSQNDFDRMGATIVELGNRMATTESKIVSMALRVAGAGTTVGMTVPQILGFSAALSSVGVNSEQGGSAISRMMVDMAKAVAQGGLALTEFGYVSGQTAAQFKASFEKDAAGAILTFLTGLKKMSSQGVDVFSVLDQINLGGIRLEDVMLRGANASGKFGEALTLANTAWSENKALTEEANKRYETLTSQFKIIGNLARDIAITIGGALAPSVRQMLELTKEWLANSGDLGKTFSNLASQSMPIIIASIATLGDAWQALTMLIKGGQIVFLGAFEAIGTGIQKLGSLWNSTINLQIDGFNKLIELNNKIPFMPKADLIQTKVDFDPAGLKDWTQAIHEARLDVQSELQKLKDAPPISTSIQENYSAMIDKMGAANKKLSSSSQDLASQIANGNGNITKSTDDMVTKTTNSLKQQDAQAQKNAKDFQILAQMSVPELAPGLKPLSQKANDVDAFKRNQQIAFGSNTFLDQGTTDALKMKAQIDAAQANLKTLESIDAKEDSLRQKKLEAVTAYNTKLKQLYSAEASMLLTSYSKAFGDMADAVAAFGDKTNALYLSLFAASKAFAIADAIVKIQQGIASAFSLPFPANLAAAASVVSATASIVSNIAAVSLTFSGKNGKAAGGPVKAGSMYMVGEMGRELFVPNQDGSIVSNTETESKMSRSQSMANKTTNVTIHNYTGVTPEVKERNDNGQRTVEVILRQVKRDIAGEIRDGRGEITRSMESSYRLRRGVS